MCVRENESEGGRERERTRERERERENEREKERRERERARARTCEWALTCAHAQVRLTREADKLILAACCLLLAAKGELVAEAKYLR